MTIRLWRVVALLAVAALAVVMTAALVSRDGTRSGTGATSSSSSSTTEAAKPTTTTVDNRVFDWAGERWDFGAVVALARKDGGWEVVFDRKQLYQGDTLRSGKGLIEEPVLAGYITDEPTVNENGRLRTYRVAPDADVALFANRDEVCQYLGDDPPPPVRWRTSTVPALAESREYHGFPWVAITFDNSGSVVRIRLSEGC